MIILFACLVGWINSSPVEIQKRLYYILKPFVCEVRGSKTLWLKNELSSNLVLPELAELQPLNLFLWTVIVWKGI